MPSFPSFPHVCYILCLSTFLGYTIAPALAANITDLSDVYHKRYSCVCDEHSTRSSMYTNPDFRSTIENIRCCKGLPRCSSVGNANTFGEDPRKPNSMICFNDLTCLINTKTYPSMSLLSCTRKANNCSTVYYQMMNISNEHGQKSDYKCFWVSHLNSSLCLLPECRDFAVVERTCDCLPDRMRCTCFAADDLSHPTYALFISFKDMFITKPHSFSYSLLTIMFSIIAVSGLLVFFQFRKPLKSFICSRISHLSCCCKRNANTAITSLNTSGANSDIKVEVSVIPLENQENENSALPSYDEAVKTVKMFSVEPPPKYHEAVI